MPVVNGGDVTKQHVELSASYNDGSKVGVEDMLDGILKLTWESTDSLFVYDGTGFCGCLKFKAGSLSEDGKSAAFEGDLDVHGTPTKMYFYYYGKSITDKIKNEEMPADNVTVSFSEQAGTIESVKTNLVIKGEDNYNVENKYGAEMKVQFAIAKLAFKGFTSNTDITVTGISSCGFTVNAAGSLTPDAVASMALTKPVAETDFYTVFMEKNVSTKYTFTTGTLSANLQATFENNKFYTKDASGEAKLLTASQPEGWLSGEFTVNSEGLKVHFSKGNLQYLGTGDSKTMTPQWRFADRQWDRMGLGPDAEEANRGNVSFDGYSAYNTATFSADETDDMQDARDLFGWGTTGYQDTRNGNPNYQVRYQPYSTRNTYPGSSEPHNYDVNYYGYGPNYYSATKYGLEVVNYSDWGYCMGGESSVWRTLKNEEWVYLFATRKVSISMFEGHSVDPKLEKSPFGMGAVDGIHGLILLPDNWDGTADPDFVYGLSKNLNTYNIAEWTVMEQAGVAFLPACGNRKYGQQMWEFKERITYWTSSCSGNDMAMMINFHTDNSPNWGQSNPRYDGYSVRLVINSEDIPE